MCLASSALVCVAYGTGSLEDKEAAATSVRPRNSGLKRVQAFWAAAAAAEEQGVWNVGFGVQHAEACDARCLLGYIGLRNL